MELPLFRHIALLPNATEYRFCALRCEAAESFAPDGLR